MGPRFLRLPEVINRTGLGRASIYARMAEQPPRFPSSVPLGGHAVGWVESEISQWVEDRIREARGESVAA
jgi:prophage regulatory protein